MNEVAKKKLTKEEVLVLIKEGLKLAEDKFQFLKNKTVDDFTNLTEPKCISIMDGLMAGQEDEEDIPIIFSSNFLMACIQRTEREHLSKKVTKESWN